MAQTKRMAIVEVDDPEAMANLDAEAGTETDEEIEASRRAEEVQTTVKAALERAVDHYRDVIEPDLVKATDYYHGRPFGNEQPGRSKVVSRDVGDATRAQMPSLLRVFFSSEKAVEFRGRGTDDDQLAAQMTDYVNYVITDDNDGFITFHSWFKDALVRRLGWVKWWWETTYRVEAAEYTGLNAEAFQQLNSDESTADVEILNDGPDGIDCRVTRRPGSSCARFAAVPPEEIVFTPESRDVDSAALIAHVREVTVDYLLSIGVDEDLVDRSRGKEERRFSGLGLEAARQIDGFINPFSSADTRDPSQEPVLYAEAYMRVDGDNDGVGELRRFRCVGPDYEIDPAEPLGQIVDEVPLAPLCPEPEPHTLIGLSNFDLLEDVQLVKSQILRGTLDSLSQSIEPKTEIVQGEVHVGDLLSPEVNGLVRVSKPGMMREILHTFIGPDTLPMLAHYDEIKEARTGHTKAAAGLDADSLQSSTKAAVSATLSASQQRLEMIARIFAETGVKRLFKGILRLVSSHQDHERIVKLRGKYVTVDPRRWNATMDVKINVALGQGTPEERLNVVSGVVAVQKELLAAGSPLVTNVELRRTLAQGLQLAGWSDPDLFFRPWGPEEEKAHQEQMSQQPPPPDPNTMLVQIEQQKVQGNIQLQQAKFTSEMQLKERELELREREIQLTDDRERDRLAREFALKQLELEMKYGGDRFRADVDAEVAMDRAAQDAAVRREQSALDAGVRLEAAHLDADVRREQAELQADTAKANRKEGGA